MKPQEQSTRTTIIAVASEKGGVGKTTLAVNLAGVLAPHGPTILIDDDPIASATLWGRLGVKLERDGLPFPVLPANRVPQGVVAASRWVVVDTPAQATTSQIARLLDIAHRVVIPAGVTSLDALPVMHLWERIHSQPGADKVKVVVTKAPPGQLGAQIRAALATRGIPVAQTIIRAYAAHQKAAERGCLVEDVPDPRAAAAWGDVVQLARELVGEEVVL